MRQPATLVLFVPSFLVFLAACGSSGDTGAATDTATAGMDAAGSVDLRAQANPAFAEQGLRHFGRTHEGFRLHMGTSVAELGAEGVSFRAKDATDGALRVRADAFGRGGDLVTLPVQALEGVQEGIAIGASLGGPQRLEATRGAVTEWWKGNARGLEQGWTVPVRPAGDELLGVHLDVEGGDTETDGTRAWLVGDDGVTVTVEALAAWDAEGTALQAWMEADGEDLVLRVDDRAAAYPVTIDPWYTTTATEIQHTVTRSGSNSRSSLTGEVCKLDDCHNAQFGRVVMSLGDVTSDNRADLVVATAAWDISSRYTSDMYYSGPYYQRSRVFVYYGSALGLSTTAALSLTSGVDGDAFGTSINSDGDFNGDGRRELLISAPYADVSTSDAGVFYIYGGTSAGFVSAASSTIRGAAANEEYGQAYRYAIGDVNGDGKDDLVVGVPYNDTRATDAGKIVVYYGSTAYVDTTADVTLYGEVAYDLFGYSLGVADVNGDGKDDLIVGAPNNDDGGTNAGKVYVFEGRSAGLSTTASHGQYGASGQQLGLRVTALNDINGDGYDDVYLAGSSGSAKVFHGDAAGITGTADQTWSPNDIAPIADFNGDGYDDLRIGTTLKYGSASGVMGTWASTDYLKHAGDFDGDGYTDLAFGDENWDDPVTRSNPNNGRIWIRYGYEPDIDTDGFLASEDCDDNDATVYPGADEIVGDGADNDCDGAETCYADADADGFAADDGTTVASADGDCDDAGEADATVPRTDCDDGAPLARPGGTELAGDGVDQDCNGADLCYADLDGDRFRSSTGGTVASVDMDCSDAGEATSTTPATDCDDANAAVNPSATEIVANGVDNDCNGAESCYVDADEDGYRDVYGLTVASSDMDCSDSGEATSSDPATDCDDDDRRVHPGAAETVLDGIDQDCNGGDDCYADVDGDGFAAADGSTVPSSDLDCDDGGEADVAGEDCNDLRAAVNPGASETLADEIDYDCDGTEICRADADDDGYRASTGATVVSADTDCDDAGEASSTEPGGDCNDASAAVRPGATDTPGDGIDGDCDGAEVCYEDGDGDRWPAAGARTVASADGDCLDLGEAPARSAPDCNDGNILVYPGAPEAIVDGIDQDCDGGDACYADADGDGFRDASGATVLSTDADCADRGEASAAAPATDCDDSSASVRPTATEIVGDGIDNNCDGLELCYVDADNDGYRTLSGSTVTSTDLDCDDAGEAVAADPATDCDDRAAAVNPGASESIGDGVDSDCDGTEECYTDADGDNYRSTATVTSSNASCTDAGEAPSYVATGDCDDSDATTHPGAIEAVADAVDNDCDGYETCYVDTDADGYAASDARTVASRDLDCRDAGEASAALPRTDCDDTRASVNPGAAEVIADGRDTDCDGRETCYVDADSDGHVTTSRTTTTSTDLSCAGSGLATTSAPVDDCDDTNASVHPGITEIVGDGLDGDCNGTERCYTDADGDSYRGSTVVVSSNASCADAGEAAVSMASGDCNDADASAHPGATEAIGDAVDNDCDGFESCYADADRDGYAALDGSTVGSADADCNDAGEALASLPRTDCDDGNASAYPGATEITADAVDNDCDGSETCYVDADGDGHATEDRSTVASTDLSCRTVGLATASMPADDCDDAAVAVFGGARELVADGVDQDCDGGDTCYLDGDRDGARSSDGASAASADLDCADPGEATSSADVDCDDGDASVNPSVAETPADGVDSDCDGAELCYADADRDGFRLSDPTLAPGDLSCTGAGIVGSSTPVGDCDDTRADVNPDGVEAAADGADQDCDGLELCFVDGDGDGYRTQDGATVLVASLTCEGEGIADADAPDTDCDDNAMQIHPSATEAHGNGVDEDCDGLELCYADLDGDGYRTAEIVMSLDEDCEDVGEALADLPLVDCNDALASAHPGATEVEGDGLDQDCDGVDPGGADDPAVVVIEQEVAAETAKGGCSTTGSSAPLGAFATVASLALVLRRRRA